MKIKSLSKVDRPREKLEKYGSKKLANHELLAIVLGSGIQGTNVVQLSKKILVVVHTIGKDKITLRELCEIKGLGKAKASQVLAAIALGGRFEQTSVEILSAEDVWKLCADFRGSKKEHFVVFYLDTQRTLIERQIISIGTLTASLVHPREVFEPAIALRSASILIVHNHPSGKLDPSGVDRVLTANLKAAGDLLGIPVEDHIILGNKGYLSFKQQGLI